MVIFNASSMPLNSNPGTLPNVSDTLMGYFQTMVFTKITKSVVNHELVEVGTDYTTQGVRQPFTAQQLMMKPEGQRQWLWETMHALRDVVLLPDDVIVFAGVRYRVMQKLDWKEYGFLEYQIIQDFT